MLTGRLAFAGDTTQDLIASTIKDDPDLSLLPPHTPTSAQVLLRLMLIKDARSRLADASACRVLLEDAIQSHNKEQREAVSRPAVQISVEHFVLGENICRRLDRSRLDSRMIGHQMEYLGNKKNSDVLVILLHGPGFNHEQWREHILTLPYLCVAPTQVGFEQDPQVRYRLSIRDHIIVLREFIRDQVARCRPEHTILLGFSAGGDLAMRLVAEFDDEPIPLDGLIAMEPNLAIETCHITSLLAAIDPDDNTTLLKTMQAIGQSMTTLNDWAIVHEYLVQLTGQYQDDFSVVIEYANEIIKPFQTPGPSPFIEWYRSVSAQIPELRCVFSNSKDYYDRILKIRLANLDDHCLGPHYKEDSIQTESGTTHLDLIHIDIVKRHLQDVVQQLAGNRIQK